MINNAIFKVIIVPLGDNKFTKLKFIQKDKNSNIWTCCMDDWFMDEIQKICSTAVVEEFK